MQELSKKEGGVCEDGRGRDESSSETLREEGRDSFSGSGEHNEHREEFCEAPNLASLNPRLLARFERQKEKEKRLTREQKEGFFGLPLKIPIKFDEPLSRYTTIGIGGPAESFAIVDSVDELKIVLGFVSEQMIDFHVLGGGSNTLIKDGGLRGLIIKLGDGFDTIVVDRTIDNDVYVSVGSATPTQRLVKWAADEGFSGLEFLAGVWGTVGGNLVGNAGTNTGSIGDVVEELTLVSREQRELTMKKQALKFEYRNLKITRTATIVKTLFKLTRSTPSDVHSKVATLMEKRRATQPVGVRSLGCTFKNPGKTSAGVLIEDALLKGVRVGGARVSTVHANFIVNEGNATARDFTVLMNLVRERVKESSGVVLETEIEIIGEEL